MRQPLALVCPLLISLAVGQTIISATESSTITVSGASASETSGSSTSAEPVTHTIGVGKGGHTLEPDVTLARVGDTIKFEFYPTNHTIVRAEYGYPCIPYEYTGVDKIGFYTGFKPVDAILDSPPSYSFRVNDTDPIFFYCGAPGSCIDWQMVGTVNPNASTSLARQKQLAKDSSFMLLPGQPWPDEAETPFTTSSPSTSTTPTHSSSSSTETSSASAAGSTSGTDQANSSHSGLSTGAIAGIALGVGALALGAGVLLFLCGRQSRKHNQMPPVGFQQPPAGDRPGTAHTTMGSVMYNSHGHIASQYMPMHHNNHVGHMSNAALPGYVPQYDPTRSPPLNAPYTMSDALKPGHGNGSDVGSLHSVSPSPLYAVPPYQIPPHHQTLPYTTLPPPAPANIHEMAGSDTSHAPTSYVNRQSSITKYDGVERYR